MAGARRAQSQPAMPDGAVVWDAWLRKQPDRREELLARLRRAAVDEHDPTAIAEHLLATRPFADTAQALALASLHWHGAASLPVIVAVLDHYALKRADTLLAPCARMLQAIHSEAAVDCLLARLSVVSLREVIERHANRWPVWVLRKLLALKPARQHPAALLIQRLLHAHPEWQPPLHDACTSEERQTLARVLAPADSAAVAPLSALPLLLQQAPWSQPDRRTELPMLALPAVDAAPALHWQHYPGSLDPPDLRGRYFLGEFPTQVEMVYARASADAPAAARSWDLCHKALWCLGLSAEAIATAVREQHVQADMFGPRRHSYFEPELLLWHLPPALAISVLEHCPTDLLSHFPWYENAFARLLHWLGPAALPGFRRWIRRPPRAYMPLFLCIEWSVLVPEMAQWYCSNRWRREDAAHWLQSYPQSAARALIPLAFGAPGAERDQARQTLIGLAASGQRQTLVEAAASLGETAAAALAQLLALRPDQMLPDTLPTLPKKLHLPALPPLLLRDGAGAIAPEHLPDLLICLALSGGPQPYAGLQDVQAAITPGSLARFGRALLAWWLDQGTPSKERWMFALQGRIGDDETARVLATAIRQWRAALIRVRAYDGMQMLAQIGTDAALMHLHSLAAQPRYGDIASRARTLIAEIAEARGLSTEELADRSVPDLGLDSAGTLHLDYGPRQFRVHFNEFLQPCVCEAGGAHLKDLPKPKASDDATLARAAVQQYQDLKRQARSLASLQLQRLEQAMCSQRRWSAADFGQLLLAHPLLRALALRLLWGAYDRAGTLIAAFRAAEDLSLADRHDQTWSLPEDVQIGIVHPILLAPDCLDDFRRIYADYAISQPFPQLQRELYRCRSDADFEPRQWIGRSVSVGALLGLEQRGWQRTVGDGGAIDGLSKALPEQRSMVLHFCGDGWHVGSPPDTRARQDITQLILIDPKASQGAARTTLAQLDAVSTSELLRDLHRLL